MRPVVFTFFFFNDTATTEIYTLSLHDALPISVASRKTPKIGQSDRRFETARGIEDKRAKLRASVFMETSWGKAANRDRKSTRLNSSHGYISYAVFCLKKKKNIT